MISRMTQLRRPILVVLLILLLLAAACDGFSYDAAAGQDPLAESKPVATVESPENDSVDSSSGLCAAALAMPMLAAAGLALATKRAI